MRLQKSDEDFHHLAVCFLLAERGWKGACWLGVDLDRKPPFEGAAVKHRHICANTLALATQWSLDSLYSHGDLLKTINTLT